MVIVGNRMWKLMFAANWMRASRTGSVRSLTAVVFVLVSGRVGGLASASEQPVLELEHLADLAAERHQPDQRIRRELAHLGEPQRHALHQLVHLAHAGLSVALLR